MDSRRLLMLLPAASLMAVPLLPVPSATASASATGHSAHATLRSNGMFGYSGNPAHNSGQICSRCHSGGAMPDVTLDGPTMVQAGKTYTFDLLIENGQETAGGFNVSVTDGTLADSTGETQIDGDADEITHNARKNADANGDVLFSYEWTAPATGGQTVTMYGAGNSVNSNSNTSGDLPDADQLAIQVEDCLVDWCEYGAGTPGDGGFVPKLSGVAGPCTGGAVLEISDGLGGALGFLWPSDATADLDFACGKVLVDPSSPFFIPISIKLGGPNGVAGAGNLSLPVGDLTALQGLTLYLQGLFLDSAACKQVALSNGLELKVGT